MTKNVINFLGKNRVHPRW